MGADWTLLPNAQSEWLPREHGASSWHRTRPPRIARTEAVTVVYGQGRFFE